MSYFTEVFPEKYACTSISLLREGFGLLYDGTGDGLKVRCIITGARLNKYQLLRPGQNRTINPLYGLLDGRYNSGNLRRDVARMFRTSDNSISWFITAMRNEWFSGNQPSDEDEQFAVQLGYYFGARIFGLGYLVGLNTLKKSNYTFAWDTFKVAGIPIDNIRIRA